jgi:hypothetical protein
VDPPFEESAIYAGTVRRVAPLELGSEGRPVPSEFNADTLTKTKVSNVNEKGDAARVLIGIIHCIFVTIVEEPPLQ